MGGARGTAQKLLIQKNNCFINHHCISVVILLIILVLDWCVAVGCFLGRISVKNKGCIVMFLSALMLISCAGSQPVPENAAQTQAEPQPAKIVPAPAPDNHPGNDVVEFWGEKVPDPYRWLEDASQEDVQAWMKAQDTRSRDYLAQMPMREHFEKRPDLFGAVLCGAPLLDMLRYHLFAIGLHGEYGNPEASEAEFKNILAYSPYHNVKKTAYPSVLFLSADSDNRANPMHARKMTAAVQGATTSNNPVLLRIEKNAGHHGAGTVRSVVEENADVYSFLMYVLE